MEKTINIDFDNSSSVILGYSADILDSTVDFIAWKSHTHGTVLGYNLSATSLSNGLTLSVAPPGAAINSLFAGDYITLSTAGANTTVSVYGLQSSGPYLTTAAATDHNHGEFAQATGVIGGTIGGTGFSLSIPDFLLTAAQSDHTHSEYIPLPNSTQYATSWLANTFLTTAARVTHIHGIASGTNITIGSSSNGLALSVAPAIGTNTSLGTISGSTVGFTGNTSGITLNMPNFVTVGGNNVTLSGNTSGTMTLISSGTMTLVGGNNVTLSQEGNSVVLLGEQAGIGTNTSVEGVLMTANTSGLTISLPAVTATAANQVAAGDYISISTNGVVTTVSAINLQATSNTSIITTNAVHTSERANYFYTSNNTFANSTHGHGSVSLDLMNLFGNATSSSNGLTLALTANVAGTGSGLFIQNSVTTITSGTAYLSNTNGVSFGITGNTITASHNAFSTSSQITATFLTTGYTSHTHSNLYPAISGTTYYLSSNLSTAFALRSHTHGSLYTTNINGTSASSGLSLSVPIGSVYFVNGSNTNLTFYSSSSGSSTSIYASAGGGTGGGGSGGIGAQITGNTSGTTALLTSGTLTLGGGSGITLSQSGSRINIIGEQGSICFTGGSNVTWGSSTSGNNTSIFLTAGGITGGGGGTDYLYLLGDTAASSSVSYTGGSFQISVTGLQANFETGTYGTRLILSADSGLTAGIAAMGNTGSSNAFTSGSVMLSGVNLTVDVSSTSQSQYLRVSAPPMGYLFFGNIAGFSFTTSIDGVSTTVGLSTA